MVSQKHRGGENYLTYHGDRGDRRRGDRGENFKTYGVQGVNVRYARMVPYGGEVADGEN